MQAQKAISNTIFKLTGTQSASTLDITRFASQMKQSQVHHWNSTYHAMFVLF